MAFDDALAERIRAALDRPVDERRMFGGIAFMVDGHMACGVIGDDLVLRLGPEGAARALEEPHVRPMDFTGRPSRTSVYVEPEGVREDRDLERWVAAAVRFVGTLPPPRGGGRGRAGRAR
jgi:TfoX/Sxy family transcriptional regulator of competence genes